MVEDNFSHDFVFLSREKDLDESLNDKAQCSEEKNISEISKKTTVAFQKCIPEAKNIYSS